MAQPIRGGKGQALDQVATAFAKFESFTTRNDARQFQDTTLMDVSEAVGVVERRLAAKGQSRSLRRIKALLDGLEHYSKAVEVLCNGTPYLPWIWVGLHTAHALIPTSLS